MLFPALRSLISWLGFCKNKTTLRLLKEKPSGFKRELVGTYFLHRLDQWFRSLCWLVDFCVLLLVNINFTLLSLLIHKLFKLQN